MAQLRLRLLGDFRVDLGGTSVVLPRKSQALLAFLALCPDRAHSRTRLAGLLWGDRGEEQARNSLRQAIFAIRQVTPSARPAVLALDGERVALTAAVVETDVETLRRRLAEGNRKALEEVATLYRGDLLEGLQIGDSAWETWLAGEREGLREQVVKAFGDLLGLQARDASWEPAIRTAIKLLALDPLHEATHRALMRIYADLGRRASALQQYQACAEVLRRELGVEPEAETRRLYREIVEERAGGPAAGRPHAEADGGRDANAEVSITGPPLTGRDTELSLLRATLLEAWDGRSRLLSVNGEAGIGKTRLLEELATVARGRGGLVVTGRAYASEQILPFGLWVAALRRIVASGDTLAGLAPAWRSELAGLFPELSPSRRSAGPENALHLFEAIALLLTHLAEHQPVLVALDDVHWADQASVRLLPFLARRLDRQPVCLALTARIEETVDHPLLRSVLTELARDDRVVEVSLPPLSREDTLGLVRVLGDAPRGGEDLGERVWQLSGGNPFVVVEAVRTLTDGTAGPVADLAVPDRVRRMVLDRLDRLGERARITASAAAVIGRACDLDLLERVSGLEAAEIAASVDDLISRHVLREMEGRVEFTHDRIREVVHAELSLPRRRLLHAAVAGAIETLRAGDLAPHHAALVTHYKEARDWARVLPHLRAAAAQAQARGAYRDAIELFEDALALLDRLPPSPENAEQGVDIRVDVRRTAMALGEMNPPLRYLDEAERLARSIGDQRRLALVFSEASHVYWIGGQYRRAIELGQRIVDIGTELGDAHLEGFGLHLVGKPSYALGDYPRAIACLERAAALLEGWDHPARGMGGASDSAAFWLAAPLAHVGRFDDALARAREAVAGAETGTGFLTLMGATLVLGSIHLDRGDLEPAIAAIERAKEMGEKWKIQRFYPWCLAALAQAYVFAGRRDEGLRLIEPGTAVLRARGAQHLFRRGEALLAAGRVGDALTLAEAAIRLAREMEERGHEGHSLRLLGDVQARLGASAEAEEAYREALAVAEELGMRPLAAQCHLGLGRCALERDRAEARAHLDAAAAAFRDLTMPLWLMRATAALAEDARVNPAPEDGRPAAAGRGTP